MPYSIRLPDGTLVDNIPDDLNPLDAKRRIIAAYPQLAPETTIFGQAGEALKGLVPGAIGLVETGVAGASALLPEEYEKAVRAKTKEIAAAAKKPFEASIGYEDTVGRKLGEAIGSTIPFLAAGPFGLAGRAAAVGLGTAAGAGEARTRAEAEGATEEQRAAATGYGIIPGAAEAFAPLRILGRLGNDIVGGGVAYVKRALIAGGEEAAQEAASGFAQNLIAKGIYKPEQELIEGLGEQAAYGGATGAIVQGLLDLAIGRRARGPAAPVETTAETPPAEPVVTNYQTIDQAGNPATISVAQDDAGTIVATGPDGEPVDLSNMVSAGFTVEESIKSVFSAPEAPVVAAPEAAPRVEPEITPQAATVAPPPPPPLKTIEPPFDIAPTKPVEKVPTTPKEDEFILQNRDRSTPASINQMNSIAANPDYGMVGFSRDFAVGAPVISGSKIPDNLLGKKDYATTSDGRRIPVQYAVVPADIVVTSNDINGSINPLYADQEALAPEQGLRAIAGNGRATGLNEAYRRGTADRYKEELLSDDMHGVDPEAIQSIDNPVLVRVMPWNKLTADIGDVSNTTGVAGLSAVDQAKTDVNRVDFGTLEFYENGEPTARAVKTFIQAMPMADQANLIDINGEPTAQAIDRFSAALFAKAYADEDLIRMFAQAKDPEARLVMSALAQLAPDMARLDGLGALDVRPIFIDAAKIIISGKRKNLSLAKIAQQTDITVNPSTQLVVELFAKNPRSNRDAIDAIRNVTNFAYQEGTKEAEDIFGAVPKATREEVLERLRREDEQAGAEIVEPAEGRGAIEEVTQRAAAEPGATELSNIVEEGRPSTTQIKSAAERVTPQKSFYSDLLPDAGFKRLNIEDPRTYKNKSGEPFLTFERDGVRVAFSSNNILFADERGRVGAYSDEPENTIFRALIVDKDQRKKGKAAQAVSEIVNMADESGVNLYLEPASLDVEGMTTQQLKEFYKRFGFKPQKATGPVPQTDKVMVRMAGEPREELKLTGESNAEIAARLARQETDREAAERKAIADRERGLFTLTPQVSEAESAPTGDMFGARGLADQAPKRAAAPATETGLFENKISFQKAPPYIKPPEGYEKREGRNEQVVMAARLLAQNKITKKQYDDYVNYFMPVAEVPLNRLEPALTETELLNLLNRPAVRAGKNTKLFNAPIPKGTKVGLRMDIKALQEARRLTEKGIKTNGSIVSVHKGSLGGLGENLSYTSTGAITNATMLGRKEERAFKQAQDVKESEGAKKGEGTKEPLQTIEGTWMDLSPEEVEARIKENFNNPDWVQVGFDPLRHSFFYDRKTLRPIVSADEVLQIGRFVLAKNVKYSDREKFLYSVAGKPVGDVTDIAEAQRVEKALKGKNPLQAAKWMADNATNPEYRLIANRIADRMQKLMDAGVPFKLHIVGVGDKVPVGLLSADGMTASLTDRSEKKVLSVDIWLNNSTVTGRVGTEEKIVLHELIHAVTAGATYLGNLKSMQGTEAAKLFTRLYDVRNAVVRHFNSRVKSVPIDQLTELEKKVYVNGANALKDEDEVLAWSLTDPDMQAYLESIPYKGKTAWNAFVDAIREFLGLPKAKETALSEVLAIADELFVLPVIESGKQELIKSAPSAKPIATQDQINLFNASVRGQKVKMTPTAEGQAALDTINDLGRQVEETPTMRQKAREYWDNATDNPQATKEAAKKATVRFLDKIETYVFNSDAAINNAIRRLIKDTTMSEQEKMGILLSISSSQAVHPDALANLFIRYGGLNYDPSIYKYVATDKKDNFVSLVQGIDTIGSKYGLTKEQAERVSHTAFEAKRLSSIARFNRALKVEIDDLRDMARTSPDPTARDLASKEVRRKVKDFKFVHMTDEQIQRGLDLFKTIPELNALVDTWNGIRENSRKELVESGLWSEQEAEGLLSNMDYVPFYREDQLEKGKGPKEFLRNLQVQAKEKKLKGSDKPVADIFDNMARWTQYAVKRSVMNRLALAKIDAAVEMGIAKKIEKQKQGDNSVRVWRDGNAEYYSLDDPLFMEAFTGLESVAIPSLKYFAKLSNWLRKSVVLYPLFSVSQVPQDAFAAMFSSGLKTRFALTIPARAAKEFVKTLFKSSQTHKELERIGVVGIRDFTAAIAREDAEIYAGLKARPGVLNKVKSFLEHISMSSDNAVRQAVYEASIAQGLSRAEAIEKAFNLINFRNRGSSKELAAMGQVIPFFNAYLAAQHVAIKTISGVGISPTERKAALGTLAATTASVMTLSLIYAMLIGDDEDYLNKPSVMRDRLFMIPGTGLSIPIRSDIFSIPKIITEHMYMLMTDNGASDGRKFRDSMKAALGNALFSPTVVPQAIKPLAEVGINYNFFQGRPLVGTYQKGLETERQFNDSTSELAKWFGQTGLISPIAADHLIRGMFGSAGGLMLYMTNFALHNDPEVPRPSMSFMEAVAALPGTSGFVSKEYETALKNDFYVLRDEVSTAVNTLNDLKKRSPSEIDKFLDDETNLTRVGMAKTINKITKSLTNIRREISRITASNEMSASEKAEEIKELKAAEREILQSVDLKALREMANL